jgi:hypothetical protein
MVRRGERDAGAVDRTMARRGSPLALAAIHRVEADELTPSCQHTGTPWEGPTPVGAVSVARVMKYFTTETLPVAGLLSVTQLGPVSHPWA